MTPLVLLELSAGFIILGILLYQREQRRLPVLRFEHLMDESEESFVVSSPQSLDQSFSQKFSEKKKILISFTLVIISVLSAAACGASFNQIIGLALGMFGISVIGLGRVEKILKEKQQRQIAQMTPLVMERLVMAVESGLDIVPSIKSVIEIDKLAKARQKKALADPVVDALSTVITIAERGTPFEEALKLVAKKYESHALTHAFVHLGIAFKEGGEVIGPLRELSDATQNYYQETIEEDLAKLPVKATAPLIVTFAGLILFFLSSPLVQIISFAARAVPTK